MICKIENNKTSYPLISVSNSILVYFMNLATDIGSFLDAGRLFHNTDPLNFNKRLPKEEFTDSRCMLLLLSHKRVSPGSHIPHSPFHASQGRVRGKIGRAHV